MARNIETERFSDIYIKAFRPFISLEIRTFGVRIYISEDETTKRGIFSKIRDILKKRERRYFGKVINALSAIPAIIAMSCVAFFAEGEYKYAGAMFLGAVLSIYPIAKYQTRNKVVVLTDKIDSKPSFLKRRKDNLVIGSIAASVGALI